MLSQTALLPSILALLHLTTALNITNPKAGDVVSTQYDLYITWTSNSLDPSFIDLVLSNPNTTGASDYLAINVTTSFGNYTVPAHTINKTGSGFEIIVNSIGTQGNALVDISGKFTINNSTPSGPGNSASSSSSAAATASSTTISGEVAATVVGKLGLVGAIAAGVFAVL